MANPRLFGSAARRAVPADTINEAGGLAYELNPAQALAQIAATGTLGDTFYASAEQQLDAVKMAASTCSDEFVAQCAIYARERGLMKDMPALLVSMLLARVDTDKSRAIASAAFKKVVDNGRMIRNVVQMLQSGMLGRKTIPQFGRRLIREWFDRSSPEYLFRQSVGNEPSLAEVIFATHPKPRSVEMRALFGYLRSQEMGDHEKRPVDIDKLSDLVRAYIAFKESPGTQPVPRVPFQMLDSLGLTSEQWAAVFAFPETGYQFTRMNLNTALRQGVFKQGGMDEIIAKRLRDPELLRKARQFPYQLFSAYKHVADGMPRSVIDALHDAMELSCENVPVIEGRVAIAVDSSGSMGSPITGSHGRRQATKMVCADVAGMIAACFVRKNPDTLVMQFDTQATVVKVEPRDTVATLAKQLNRRGGGTACWTPLHLLNEMQEKVDLFVIVSDDQSWYEGHSHAYGANANRGTSSEKEWNRLKGRCRNAKQVRINLQPYGTSQASKARKDTLLVGGFNDTVFDVIAAFTRSSDEGFWVSEIEKVPLTADAS